MRIILVFLFRSPWILADGARERCMSPFPSMTHRDVAELDLRVGSYGLSRQSPVSVLVQYLIFAFWNVWWAVSAMCGSSAAREGAVFKMDKPAFWSIVSALFYLLVFPPQRETAVWTPMMFSISPALFFLLQTGELLTLLAPYMAASFSHTFNGWSALFLPCFSWHECGVQAEMGL